MRELKDQHKHNDNLEDFINGVPGLLAYWSRDLRNVIANNKYLACFGKTSAQIKGMLLRDLIGSETFKEVEPLVQRVLNGHSEIFDSLNRFADGSVRTLRIQYQPDMFGGMVVGFFVMGTDITDQKDLQNYHKVVLDSIYHGVWGLDTDGQVTFINRTATKLLGYDQNGDLLGKHMHKLVHYAHEDGRPHLQKDCPMYDSFRNGRTHHIDSDVLWRKDGSSFPIAYSSAPIIVDGKCIGSVVSFEDRTEKKRLEEELAKQRRQAVHQSKLSSLGEMAAGIAHEINNPLTIIDATIQLLALRLKGDEKVQRQLDNMAKGVTRIAKIVNGLRKFSRTSEQAQYNLVRLDQIIGEALILTGAKARRHATPVDIECPTDCSIFCDEIEMEQVLVILINNAIDAIKDKDPRWVKISAFEDESTAVIQIRDCGTGIPEAVRARLFQPFFTTKPVGEGTGLGLSIVSGILSEHKAKINILADDPNTCFEIRFPLTRSKTDAL